uniref:Uncharacterized protein n=1 Tax=Arundo donax TaxID=35708 RepID=A0A0A8ZAK0_ARUDO
MFPARDCTIFNTDIHLLMLPCGISVICSFAVYCFSVGERCLLGILRQTGREQSQVQVLPGSEWRYKPAQVPSVSNSEQRGQPLHKSERRCH